MLHWFSLNLAIFYQAVAEAAGITGAVLGKGLAAPPGRPLPKETKKDFVAGAKPCGKNPQVFSFFPFIFFLNLLPQIQKMIFVLRFAASVNTTSAGPFQVTPRSV